VRKIDVSGELQRGVYAKDIILRIIADLGVGGGKGYAYEYNGEAIHNLSMEGRMTICNMSIEGGARVGYVNPDQTTFDYIRGRRYAPEGEAFDRAVEYWKSIASPEDAEYDDVYHLNGSELEPMVTWGINPGQAMGISETTPYVDQLDADSQDAARKAYQHMRFSEGEQIKGKKIDVAFLGSCTNSRISDLREAARIVEGQKVHPHVEASVVPGSKQVAKQAEAEGLPKIFEDAGFEWRGAGCSMCLGMNPDKLKGDQISASSSNRNFIGRQGSPSGRTILMSPAMVAAAAISGEVVDVREFAAEPLGV
jgi:3-isopropylmalate/(R)-2-methylmalate dehydratase large subunit